MFQCLYLDLNETNCHSACGCDCMDKFQLYMYAHFLHLFGCQIQGQELHGGLWQFVGKHNVSVYTYSLEHVGDQDESGSHLASYIL